MTMTDGTNPPTDLDEILSRAVDRQIAEQRALRQSLDELRASVSELASRPAKLDLTPLEERIQSILRSAAPGGSVVDIVGLEDRLRSAWRSTDESIKSAIHSSVLGASESTFASLSEQLRSLREAIVPQLEHAAEANAAVRAMGDEISSVRETVGGVASDLEGIAQALIEFNSGLRGWASGLDDSVSSIKLTVGDLYALTTQPAASKTGPMLGDDEDDEGGKPAKGDGPAPGIEERIRETAELSEYLADQIEDLDGLMGRLTELPSQLEGVVSQALKRTLTARAKLDKEAETALDDVLEALDEHVNRLSSTLGRFDQEEDHLRKLALEQVELTSRIESLQATVMDRIERIDSQRRHGEEALAVAIDRQARGLAPRALESLSKSAKRRTPAAAATPRKAAKTSGGRKKAATAKSAKSATRSQPKAQAKRAKQRKPRRRPEWTPLPDASDDTLA
jgi:chromosome segregation ATPase